MSRAGSPVRGFAITTGSLLGFLFVGATLMLAMDRADVRRPPSELEVTEIVEDRLAALAESDPHHALARVFLLGDSTSIPVPDRLQDVLADAAPNGRRIRVLSLAILGQTTFDQYFLSEIIARGEPDAVVIDLHLAGFSDSWRKAFAKPEFAGWLPLSRIAEVLRLPLYWVGLSTDEWLWYRAIVGTGAEQPWRALLREQVRVGQAIRDAGRGFAALVGSNDRHQEHHAFALLERTVAPGPRFTRAGAQGDYDPVLRGLSPAHPVLAMLRALAATFSERGIATLVVVMPANVEHLHHLGLLAGSALPRSLAAIEAAARAGGADFLDLHDALPDAAFVDATGHFGGATRSDGAGGVVNRLAPRVSALLAHGRD